MKGNILLVDDNLDFLDSTKDVLENLIDLAYQAGVCEVLNKPLDMVKLIDLIEQIRAGQLGGCILVVDDDQVLSGVLFEFLSRQGYDVAVAGDGHKAVSAAEDKFFDILLLDMKLPHQNGQEVYRHIKPLQPDLVTII